MDAYRIFPWASHAWASVRANEISAWHGHVAFAHWIVEALKPNLIVELGTHNAVSYFSFCNAVQKLGISGAAFAIDCWEGDPQAGYYSNEVFDSVDRFNKLHYAEFSTLKKSYFDDALKDFEDGSIDLLHIDGLHTYEAVRHDFETWQPKLSNRAVVLFHDTRVFRDDFGVWKFWDEITQKKAGFNFLHSAGLGVLAYGDELSGAVLELCSTAADSVEAQMLRDSFMQYSHIAKVLGKFDQSRKIQPPGVNIALNCRARQSSFYETKSETAQGAVNGNITGHFGFHTAHEHRPWWWVDLGRTESFDEIRVYNRLDPGCADRSRSLEIFISDDGIEWKKVYTHSGETFGGADGNPLRFISDDMSGRFVMLRLQDTNFLHLDEVEIFSYQQGNKMLQTEDQSYI